MKQSNLFGEEYQTDGEEFYTEKIESPIYEPKNQQPHIMELASTYKTNRLIKEIQRSNVSEEEKEFLIEAAHRHTVFNYEKCADYYAHASKEMQHLMERSALVVIDFERAIEYGFIGMSNDIRKKFLETYE